MFQVDLSARAKIKLESAAYVDYNSAVAGGSLYVDGSSFGSSLHAFWKQAR